MTNNNWIPRARVYSEHDLFLSQARAFAVAAFFGVMLLVAASVSRISAEGAAPEALGELAGFTSVGEHIWSQKHSAYVDSHFADLVGTGGASNHHQSHEQLLNPVRQSESSAEGTEVRVEIPEPEPEINHCDCVDGKFDCEDSNVIYRWHFTRLTLDEMKIPQRQNACDFLSSWFLVENSRHTNGYDFNNPLGMGKWRNEKFNLFRYDSPEKGAARFAAQLDGTLEWLSVSNHKYPAITSALRHADTYDSALDIANNEHVRNDLDTWCGCDEGRQHRYSFDIIWRLANEQY